MCQLTVDAAVEMLNMMVSIVDTLGRINEQFVPGIRNACKTIKESDKAQQHSALVNKFEQLLPPEIVYETLASKNIHGIWVQGDYRLNEEFLAALATRKNSKALNWNNYLWVYQTDGKSLIEHNGILCRAVEVDGVSFYEADFVRTMQAWLQCPQWIKDFIFIMDQILAKRAYVAIGDIMRMIVLYYSGGLYLDVKIKLDSPQAAFFDTPMVNPPVLQCIKNAHRENWALLAGAGCTMIEVIMQQTLKSYPSPNVLARLPTNYQNGVYSCAHMELHENIGPWNKIERQGDKVEFINTVNPTLALANPRAKNSWSDHDKIPFDWREVPGFNLHHIEHNGHCLFAAIAAGTRQSALELRALLANAIQKDKTLRELVYGPDKTRTEELNLRICNMVKTDSDIVWCGHREIYALSMLLKLTIALHRPLMPRKLYIKGDHTSLTAKEIVPDGAIHLYSPGRDHYDALVKDKPLSQNPLNV